MAANAKRKRDVGKSLLQSTTFQMTTVPPTTQPQHSSTLRTASTARRPIAKNQDAGRTLDGFMMLDCCHVEFPDEVTQAVLAGMNINGVVAEDLLFFTSLHRLDVSDNEAPFEPFGCLPQLAELDFQCNALQNIVVGNGFLSLEVLNLSFNCLTAKDFEELSKLLRIRELYLCNNWIRSLPPVMDRFSRLETLSLEHNNISGDEVFNFLAMTPRLRNLNLSHNKLTGFPESALTVDDTRGAGFYNLLYLNLAHNKITDEEGIIFTTELHSIRKLVIYGNPLVVAAVSSQDRAQLNYDPVPTLTASISESGREIVVVAAYPDSRKKKSGAAAYDNVEIYKILPNEIPLPSPFRSRATDFLLPPNDSEQSRKECHKRTVEMSTPPQSKLRLVDASDSTFLTGVGIEDILQSSLQNDSAIPAVPASVITRSLAVSKQTNPLKARAAVNALRYQLEHPLTSHDDSDIFPISSQRPTQAYLHRQLPRHHHDQRRYSQASGSPPPKPFTSAPSPFQPLKGSRAIDDALTQLSHEVSRTWGEKRPGREVDSALDSLMSTAQKVTMTYNDH